MDWGIWSLSFAFLAGAAASLNPCGVALVPAYLAYFVGGDSPGGLVPGVRAGIGMAAGALGVFATVGGLLSVLGYALMRFVPLAAVAIGTLVALAGLAMLLLGWTLPIFLVVVMQAPAAGGALDGDRTQTRGTVHLCGACALSLCRGTSRATTALRR